MVQLVYPRRSCHHPLPKSQDLGTCSRAGLQPLEDVQVRELLQFPYTLYIRLDNLLVIEEHPPLPIGVNVRNVVPGVNGRPLVRDEGLQTVPGWQVGSPTGLCFAFLSRGARRHILAGIIGVREEPFDRALCIVALEATS